MTVGNTKRSNYKSSYTVAFLEAIFEDVFHYIIPFIHKKSSNITFHAEKNDVKNSKSRGILDNILKLKLFIREN